MTDTIKWSRDIYTGHITGKMPERPSGEPEDRAEEVKATNEGLQDHNPTLPRNLGKWTPLPAFRMEMALFLDNASTPDII